MDNKNSKKNNNSQPRVVRGNTSHTRQYNSANLGSTTKSPSSRVVRGTAPTIPHDSPTRKNASAKPKKRKLKKSAKILITISSILISIPLILVGVFFYYFGGLNTDKLDVGSEDLNINTNLSDKYGNKKIVNVAFFGIDTRNNDNKGRSDAIMILSIDNSHNKLKLTSIARDSYVTIPGRSGKDKINHAYNYGGPELAIKTLNYNFGLDIQDYVTVNFNQLASVIDALGGVTVEITEPERKAANQIALEMNSKNKIIKSPGNVLLTGSQAVAFSRIRSIGGDSQRTDRQRDVLDSMFTKVKGMKATEYPGLVKKMMPMVVTSLSYGDIISFSPIMLKGDIPLLQTSFPHKLANPKGQTINGTWYYVYDIEKSMDILHKFIYEDVHPDDQGVS